MDQLWCLVDHGIFAYKICHRREKARHGGGRAVSGLLRIFPANAALPPLTHST